jgi:hypothetical protein
MPVGLVLRLVMPVRKVLRTTDLPRWCRQQTRVLQKKKGSQAKGRPPPPPCHQGFAR